jgi:DNA-binding NtrC family response regulator
MWPVLVRDGGEIASAVEETDVALIVLNGPCEFCRPFFQSLGQVRSTLDAPPLVVIACDSSEAFAVAALRAGANDYLTEPLDISSLDQSIAQLVPDTHPPASVADVPLTGGDVLVGASPAMQALRMHIRRVAATECNVLITGETGTGKELVAQLVHQNSKRSNHPLICVNCAAIPDSLLESELFGYERGAFTGATTTSQGKLMTANKGTVFFDEIGDMSPTAQAKILRAIEAKEVQRLGATRKYETDVRILAATHHNLDELANVEAFRRDLYFRLNVGRIHLPSLRERKSDIPGLTERMVLELNQKLGRQVEAPDGKAIRILTDHDWPGNVRELKNVVERIFINRESGRINQEDLGAVLQAGGYGPHQPQADDAQTLRNALETCNGNKSKAAERLNCSRMTVYRKMAKYGMDEPGDQKTIGAFHRKPA